MCSSRYMYYSLGLRRWTRLRPDRSVGQIAHIEMRKRRGGLNHARFPEQDDPEGSKFSANRVPSESQGLPHLIISMACHQEDPPVLGDKLRGRGFGSLTART